jgi:uncharacterized protein (DUF1697 family)
LPTYVALLRGINVGGRRKIAMSDLRNVFEALGHTDVRTYIQSGNVVFTAKSASAAVVRSAIEQRLEHDFGFDVTVILRTRKELATTLKNNPFGPEAHVTFLEAVPDRALVAALDPAPYTPDEFEVQGREVFLRCPNGYGRTKLNNAFFERNLAVKATTRNWKTATTLSEWIAG